MHHLYYGFHMKVRGKKKKKKDDAIPLIGIALSALPVSQSH